MRISLWSGGERKELARVDEAAYPMTDGREVFFQTWRKVAPTEVSRWGALEAVSLQGGATRVVRSWDDEGIAAVYTLVGVDDREVYYTREALQGGTIGRGELRTIGKNGGAERVLASDVHFFPRSVHIDPDYATWSDQEAQQDIVRVPRAGGPLQRIAGTRGRWIDALAIDACNIYVAVENPPALFARSRLP